MLNYIRNDNADAMLYFARRRSNAFLTDVDHVSFEKQTRHGKITSNRLPCPLQVVIGLCKRKETAALKIKAAVSNGRHQIVRSTTAFSFAVVRAEYYSIFNSMFPVKFSHSMPI